MHKTKYIAFAFFILMLALVQSCAKFYPVAPKDEEILDGPIAGLTYEQNQRFLAGDVAFNDDIFTVSKGLGSVFVANSCGSCHAGDGKGHPFTTLTRFGQKDSQGNTFLHMGGPQLQNRAIPGFLPETIPAGATFSHFMPPANTGLGFIDALTDASILAMADPNDADADGISGRPNWISMKSYLQPRNGSIVNNGKYIGRFGKKASTYDLLQQTASAYNQDMGISSTFEPKDVYSGLPIEPEVSNKTIFDVVFYLQTLKAPIQRNASKADVRMGKQTFMDIQCAKCHVPELKTGSSPISALSYQTFFPYSDLLLHDMGPGLDDGYTEGSANSSEWRTPLLWGLGLSKNSQGGQYFLMHDGRAKSISEAILMHGGEAEKSRQLFEQLSPEKKQQLMAFLESL